MCLIHIAVATVGKHNQLCGFAIRRIAFRKRNHTRHRFVVLFLRVRLSNSFAFYKITFKVTDIIRVFFRISHPNGSDKILRSAGNRIGFQLHTICVCSGNIIPCDRSIVCVKENQAAGRFACRRLQHGQSQMCISVRNGNIVGILSSCGGSIRFSVRCIGLLCDHLIAFGPCHLIRNTDLFCNGCFPYIRSLISLHFETFPFCRIRLLHSFTTTALRFVANSANTIHIAMSCRIGVIIHIAVTTSTGIGGVALLGAGGGGDGAVFIGMYTLYNLNIVDRAIANGMWCGSHI